MELSVKEMWRQSLPYYGGNKSALKKSIEGIRKAYPLSVKEALSYLYDAMVFTGPDQKAETRT